MKKARVGPHDERVNIQKHSFKSGDIARFQVNVDDSIINMSDLPETVRKIHQSCRDGFGICLYLRKKSRMKILGSAEEFPVFHEEPELRPFRNVFPRPYEHANVKFILK
ncbi:hypothetical protein AGR7B_Lc110117 [Agrobacterium deltaense RV3]|nr:hypothetical protein AGR7B_Lc110117 [Agrobacterium deltaense RV3]